MPSFSLYLYRYSLLYINIYSICPFRMLCQVELHGTVCSWGRVAKSLQYVCAYYIMLYRKHNILRTSYSSGGQCFYVKNQISNIDNLDSVLLSESGQSFCLLIIDGWSMLVPCSHCLWGGQRNGGVDSRDSWLPGKRVSGWVEPDWILPVSERRVDEEQQLIWSGENPCIALPVLDSMGVYW